jgi:hypothetical protein
MALTCGARAEEMFFDPIDVTTGHAVFQQYHLHGTHELSANLQHKKESSFLSDHKHGKKYRGGKHVSPDIYFSAFSNPALPRVSQGIAFTPAIPKHYRYLFFREINPPPPKAC